MSNCQHEVKLCECYLQDQLNKNAEISRLQEKVRELEGRLRNAHTRWDEDSRKDEAKLKRAVEALLFISGAYLSKVRCEPCNYQWTAFCPDGVDKYEFQCPKCKQMTGKEIEGE